MNAGDNPTTIPSQDTAGRRPWLLWRIANFVPAGWTRLPTAYRKILASRPDVAEVHYNLGVVLKVQGKLDDAAAQYERARSQARFRPRLPQPGHHPAGTTANSIRRSHVTSKHWPSGRICEAHNNLGNILREQGKLEPGPGPV